MFGPGGYQSPYYTPTGPAVRVHRTPWMLIGAGVVGLVVLMAGAGTALALLGSRNQSTASATPEVNSTLPSPTSGLIPSPVASPVSTTGGTESNDGVTVVVPPGWTVDSKDTEAIILVDPDSTGSLTVASGESSPTQSAQDNKKAIDDYFKTTYPDAQNCPNTKPANSVLDGASGISWNVCFTLTASGHSVAAAAWVFVGANPSGSVYYIVMVVTRQTNLQAFLDHAKPVLQGIHWKLS